MSPSPATNPAAANPPGPADDPPVIELRDVVKRFGDQTVLDGINLSIRRGETMVIMGGSGSGKSTILRLMIGSLDADEGEVLLFGQNICGMKERDLNAIRRRFGILFQSGALFNSMTVAENVALPLREHTDLARDIIDIQVTIKLQLVNMLHAAGKYPAEISGGMKKRAGLARALSLDPELLFYDEPSAGLDPITSAQIDQLIIGLGRSLGVTSVVVTHEMDSAFTIADRMAMLDRGRMIQVESRAWFDRVRSAEGAQADALSEREQLIRQFLRGEPEGPISVRNDPRDFQQALFGESVTVTDIPSVEPTR